MPTSDQITAFQTLLSSARTYGAMDPADVSAFQAANGAALCQLFISVTDALPSGVAEAFAGDFGYGSYDATGTTWTPNPLPPPMSYGQAARLLAGRMGVTLQG